MTIWFSSDRVAPDHMVCQVMSCTDPLLPVPLFVAAVPPQPARATTAAAAASARDFPPLTSRLSRCAVAAPLIRFLCSGR